MTDIIYTEASVGGVMVWAWNGVHLGDILMGDDGYYAFWPELRGGYWDQHILEAIAQKLKSMNKEWDEQVRAAG